MPIYEYRCTECGFQKEYLQKVSDPALTQCPECGKATFSKMLTAAGFQLKGTGWYVTDFRNGSGGSTTTKKSDDAKPDGDSKAGDAKATEAKPGDKSSDTSASTPSTSTPAATKSDSASSGS